MAYNIELVLPLVKGRLNRLPFDMAIDNQLKSRIEAADLELTRTGIHLAAGDTDDALFLADYVAWKYNNRDQPGAMPEWLRLARRERWLSGKGRNDDTG